MISITRYADALHRRDVIRLWERVFGYEAAHNSPALVIDRKQVMNDELFFVATDEDRLVGSVMAGYDGHRGWLYAVAVDPDWRHKGLGTALVQHAETALTECGCVKINLQITEGNEAVAAFYESLGYATEKRVSMGKRIAANIPH